jgi:hypothetical protein
MHPKQEAVMAEVEKVIGDKKVNLTYNGETFKVPALADEEQVRQAMSETYPDVANAHFEQDEEGNWTVTRDAGSKGK